MSEGGRPVPPSALWPLALGFCIWCSALIVIYAFHAIGCAFGASSSTLRLGLALALLVHLVAIGWLWYGYARATPDPAFGPTGSFLHWVVVWASIAAFVTVVLTLGPVLLLETCV